MARVHHVKAARKDNKALGIKKGQEYWWWANRLPGRASGVKRVSLKPPRPSQVYPPGSFNSATAALTERLGDLNSSMSVDDIRSEIEGVAEEARSLAEEQQEKYDNMPEGLQQGDTGQLLEERRDALSDFADALEGISIEDDADEDACQEAIDEAQGLDISC